MYEISYSLAWRYNDLSGYKVVFSILFLLFTLKMLDLSLKCTMRCAVSINRSIFYFINRLIVATLVLNPVSDDW